METRGVADMKPSFKTYGIFITGLLLVTLAGSACARNGTVTLKQLQDAIAQVGSMKDTALYQSDTGKHLADLASKIDPKDVTDNTLVNMESLLDSNNDLIRYWGATALGSLGPRALSAVPKLLTTFHKVDCLDGPITSADAILNALQRIGVKPPERTCARISG